MRTAVLVVLVLAAFAIFAVSASVDYVEVNERTEDRPGYVHTMSQPEVVMYDDAEQEEYDSGLLYGPVKVWGVPLPEWAVTALKELGVNLPPREPLPVPHDAPISARAPIHLPHHYKNKVERLRQRSAQESEDYIERQWIIIIKKAYRDDFVAVLEDVGKQLNERFGLQASEWFDTTSLREAKRAHQERQLQRRAEGQPEEGPWKINAEHELGHRAFEFGKRMMMMVAIPVSLAEREIEILEALRDMPSVETIDSNKVMRTMATISSQTLNQNSNYPWGLDRVDQRNLPLNLRYTYPDPTYNVVVYVVDTGIRATHQEFGGRATFGRNFISGDNINTDCNGHGTHVSGIIAGSTVGLSKRVTIVGLKVLDCSGSGNSFSVAQAINWAVNDCSGRSTKPKCLLSLSLGSKATVSDTGVESALQDAYSSGLVVVTAAGNSNLDACTVSPARSPYGITVGATTSRDAKASFSNWGACVDIWAPGVYIPSAYNTSDTAYQILSGTSQATPHVTGTAALFLGAVKNCTPSEVAGAILASSTINKVTGTPSGTVNRMLYSLVDQADVPTTAQAACQRVTCNVVSSSLTALGSWNSDAFTINSTTAQYGYFQVWLDSSADLDLQLQYYSGSSWTVLPTSSGSTGEEWIQYSTSAQGAGQYRFLVTGASAADSGAFTVYYQLPGSSQAGSPKAAAASSISAPFWLLPLFRGLLG